MNSLKNVSAASIRVGIASAHLQHVKRNPSHRYRRLSRGGSPRSVGAPAFACGLLLTSTRHHQNEWFLCKQLSWRNEKMKLFFIHTKASQIIWDFFCEHEFLCFFSSTSTCNSLSDFALICCIVWYWFNDNQVYLTMPQDHGRPILCAGKVNTKKSVELFPKTTKI